MECRKNGWRQAGAQRKARLGYSQRNIIERFFARLKPFRGIATRYDKLKSTFIAAVQFVSAIIGIN
ncbi:transposase [Komagataeibacter sp. FXV3]|uniref:transposase n=1 Tax=Komagataeibacter sp. FXV3 TaxID=2608998 RepID=UPI0038CF756B